MRVIIDECLPKRLGLELSGHVVFTVQQAGLAGMANGELLARIQGSFDAFVTIDQNLAAQQTWCDRAARSLQHTLDDVKPLVPQILAALSALQPGQIVVCNHRKLKGP